MHKDWVAILDFGSQYTHLIARRVRECGIYSEIVSMEAIVIPFFEADDLPSPGRFHFFDPYPNI